MAWCYLLLASFFEILWTYSLKYMDLKKLGSIKWKYFFSNSVGYLVVLPFAGNIVFGLINVYFFSLATRSISTGTAFAVWMGVALIGIKIVDVSFYKEAFHYTQIIYLSLILIGILGLKSAS